MKEYEARLMIDEEKYFFIITYFTNIYPNQQFIQNTNYYFDNDDLFLRNSHMTLRVRTINGNRNELTLKIKGEDGDEEINDPLNDKEADLLINSNIFPYGQVRNRLMLLPYSLDKYHQIAILNNKRLEIDFNDHLLVIDQNHYGDVTDYNIEIESKIGIRHAKEMLNKYIEQFFLPVSKEKYVGKATRAIKNAIENN